METLKELHTRLLASAIHGDAPLPSDEGQLDCLLHPEKYAAVLPSGEPCTCGKDAPCIKSCLFSALTKDETGKIHIDKDKCCGCAACLDVCDKLEPSRDTLALLYALKEPQPVYVMIAPAFIGQFSENVTPGKLRAAFKSLGFAGMVEVALFADILTLKEAFEFENAVHSHEDFLLTSCCCPVWISMIRKIYHQLKPHIPGSVSPMVACGRVIKRLHPEAKTVFIGPCLAKKAEAREADVEDAVDFVLTFQEIQEFFSQADIHPEQFPEDSRDHSSSAGRLYARTGGVSEAVENCLERIHPRRDIPIKTVHADGVKDCRALLERLLAGEIPGNFIEGMGCKGGCVGGPKITIPREEGKRNVEAYAAGASSRTPIDNPYVIELLEHLGIHSPEELLKNSEIFTRKL